MRSPPLEGIDVCLLINGITRWIVKGGGRWRIRTSDLVDVNDAL